MGRSELVRYLYQHSSWIERAFTGGILDTGTKLDFPLGEHAEIMSSETVRTFLSELKAIPPPGGQGGVEGSILVLPLLGVLFLIFDRFHREDVSMPEHSWRTQPVSLAPDKTSSGR